MNIEKEREAFIDWATSKNLNVDHETLCNGSTKFYAEKTQLAWEAWLEQAKKTEGCVVVPEAEFAILPKTITPEIEEILGMPCFKFIKAAQIYRQLGFDIPPKAEKEQSFFMFKFLHLALIHGDKCFDVFESETKAMVEAARGRNHV